MKYIIFIEDEHHKKALRKYYDKFYKHKVEVTFIKYEEYDESLKDEILIGQKEFLEAIKVKDNCIYVAENEYNAFSIYQSADLLFKQLIEYKMDVASLKGKARIYGLCGLGGNVGTTTVSINLSHKLAKQAKTLFVSLERIPSGKIYLDQDRGNSFSNALFYHKKSPESLLGKLDTICSYSSKYQFYYFSDVEYLEDILELTNTDILEFIEVLKASRFHNIVIDFGTRLEMFCNLKIDKKICVTEQDMKQYKRLESIRTYMNKSGNCDVLVVNKKRQDQCLSESYFFSFSTWFYMPFDFSLNDGDESVISMEIQNELREMI